MEDLKLHDFDEFIDNGELIIPKQELPNQTDVLTETLTAHAEEQTPSQANENWSFHNKVQAIQPKSSHGGKSTTDSKEKLFLKRRKKNKTQRISRRINRKK